MKGYTILAQNWRCAAGEIDIIAKRGTVLAFVEVKYRPTRHQALEAITSRQQQRIYQAASLFLAEQNGYDAYTIRFDAIALSKQSLPYHLCNAWGHET